MTPTVKDNAATGAHAVLIVWPEATPYVLNLWGAAEIYAEARGLVRAVNDEMDALTDEDDDSVESDAWGARWDLLNAWYDAALAYLRAAKRELLIAAVKEF